MAGRQPINQQTHINQFLGGLMAAGLPYAPLSDWFQDVLPQSSDALMWQTLKQNFMRNIQARPFQVTKRAINLTLGMPGSGKTLTLLKRLMMYRCNYPQHRVIVGHIGAQNTLLEQFLPCLGYTLKYINSQADMADICDAYVTQSAVVFIDTPYETAQEVMNDFEIFKGFTTRLHYLFVLSAQHQYEVNTQFLRAQPRHISGDIVITHADKANSATAILSTAQSPWAISGISESDGVSDELMYKTTQQLFHVLMKGLDSNPKQKHAQFAHECLHMQRMQLIKRANQ